MKHCVRIEPTVDTPFQKASPLTIGAAACLTKVPPASTNDTSPNIEVLVDRHRHPQYQRYIPYRTRICLGCCPSELSISTGSFIRDLLWISTASYQCNSSPVLSVNASAALRLIASLTMFVTIVGTDRHRQSSYKSCDLLPTTCS